MPINAMGHLVSPPLSPLRTPTVATTAAVLFLMAADRLQQHVCHWHPVTGSQHRIARFKEDLAIKHAIRAATGCVSRDSWVDEEVAALTERKAELLAAGAKFYSLLQLF